MIKIKPLVVSLLISLGGGAIVGFLTRNSMSIYDEILLPKFAPPSILFPIAWAILYTLMGISSYMIYESMSSLKDKALTVYFVQLAINFLWPFVFFSGRMFYLAFAVLTILWFLVIWMIKLFYDIKPIAAYLNVPYILWLTFAAYLNLSIALLN
ncbi:MAG: tryptophan-rich sensory protein [Clostridia bacterium]|nr:tryptophan-rich sensory protein [Clostridia bacterium]